jgi:chorismate--pyruvate lyase
LQTPFLPSPILNQTLRWRAASLVCPPAREQDWLGDNASLTLRLSALGKFAVEPLYQAVATPRPEESRLLGLPPRRAALVREVILRLDDMPVVYARSVLPLSSLSGRNRVLGHMANRSLGAELFRHPAARRDAVWLAKVPAENLPRGARGSDEPAWGRQSLFRKRGRPLLVAEVFLPAFWKRT